MVKSKLPPRSGFSLEAVEPHPDKGAIKFFFLSFKRHESQAWCGVTLRGMSRQQKRVSKTKRSIVHAVIY